MKKIDNKGFTLIEVLSVLVILSIIILVAIPNASTTLEKSKNSSNEYEKELLTKYAEIYINDNKKTIYNRLSGTTACYISTNTLTSKGYGTRNIKTTGYIIFNKNNGTLTFSNSSSGISCT